MKYLTLLIAVVVFSFLVFPECTTAEMWIFGYGSLISKESRDGTYPTDVYRPVRVQGIKRGWVAPGSMLAGWNDYLHNKQEIVPTYLGAYFQEGSICNGIIFVVNQTGLAAFDIRELGAAYNRAIVPNSAIIMMDGQPPLNDSDIVYFYNMNSNVSHQPTPDAPIVSSYVDVVMTGCLSVDTKTLSKSFNFTSEFILTTDFWSASWINDRPLPRRPWVYTKQAQNIDKLLAKYLGKDIISGIELEDPTDVDDDYGHRIESVENKLIQLVADVEKLKKGSGGVTLRAFDGVFLGLISMMLFLIFA
eukprot:TRINITY_DN13266_c0_g1_i1.p1 TRINITY_DN13266_c0_g1~~TRINITY_DN13266_c0_g1_i1.p1  ORF type:complete len:304 (-),score=33.94 TRINITY_DN13266_c0_g1_i1:91-1002(-)